MGRIFFSILLFIIVGALQATIVPQIRLLGGGPDLIFLMVLAWSINADLEDGIIWAFVGGIAQDLQSLAPIGTSSLGLLILVFAISGLGRQVYRIGLILLIGLVLFGTLFHQLILIAVLWLTGHHIDFFTDLAYVVAPTIFYNLLLILPVYWFVRRIQHRIARPTLRSFS